MAHTHPPGPGPSTAPGQNPDSLQFSTGETTAGPPERCDPAFPFAAFRRLRFGDRPTCPHCECDRIQRWGGFSGRRRYRCSACRRTFSDFTGTALAYVKRLPAWIPYCSAMRDAVTVRAAARCAGVSTATSFRWRHRILSARDDDGALGLVVTIGETWFQHSEKGSRSLKRPARPRRIVHRHEATPVWVLIARDETRRVASDVVGFRRPEPEDVVESLVHRLLPGSEIVSRFGRYGAAARAAELVLQLPHRPAGLSAPEVVGVKWYTVRLHKWMRRFRGVATRYLSNYLAWHRFEEGAQEWGLEARVAAGPADHPP